MRQIRKSPGNCAYTQEAGNQNEERRIVSAQRRLAVAVFVSVVGSVHFAWIDDEVEHFPDGRLKIKCSRLEEAPEHGFPIGSLVVGAAGREG